MTQVTYCYGLASVVMNRPSCVNNCWANLYQTVYVGSVELADKNCKFHNPLLQGKVTCVNKCKIDVFKKNLLLYSMAGFKQIKYSVIGKGSTRGRVYKNFKFHDPWGRGFLC